MKAALLGWLSGPDFDLADFRAALKVPVSEGVLGATVALVSPVVCVSAVPLLCRKFLGKRVPPRLLVISTGFARILVLSIGFARLLVIQELVVHGLPGCTVRCAQFAILQGPIRTWGRRATVILRGAIRTWGRRATGGCMVVSIVVASVTMPVVVSTVIEGMALSVVVSTIVASLTTPVVVSTV